MPSDAADPLVEAPLVGAPVLGPAVLGPAVLGPADEADAGKFTVRLDNFTGPFDLLLQLIGKHKLDVTEVALHQVTDDFIAYIRAMGDDWDLGEASEFLLVAATLLDLKAARLLPAAEVEDEEDLALLEARDLLFARLLQYKAFKEAAAHLAELEATGARRWPRAVAMEPRFSEALPELVLGVGPERLFKLALRQFSPKPGPPEVSIAHIHQVRVSVREHANLLRERLRRSGHATFSLLVADCDNTLEVVARFLALLELYREGLVEFEQPVSLDELTVRWVGGDDAGGELEIDDYEGMPAPAEAAAPPPEPVTDEDIAAMSSEEGSGNAFEASSDAFDPSPDAFDASSDGFDASPDAFDASPDAFDASPDAFDASPDGFDASPDGLDASPEAFDASSDGFDASPDAVKASPEAFDAEASSDGSDVEAAPAGSGAEAAPVAPDAGALPAASAAGPPGDTADHAVPSGASEIEEKP